MGWWSSDKDGHSFAPEAEDPRDQMLWGDEPADVMADAIFKIKIAFMRDLNRLPSADEIVAGIKFQTNGLVELDGLVKTPRETKELDAQQRDLVETFGWTATGGDQPIHPTRLDASRKIHGVIDALTGQKDERPVLKTIASPPPELEAERVSHWISEDTHVRVSIQWLAEHGYIGAVTSNVKEEGVTASLLFRRADAPDALVMMAQVGDRLAVYPDGSIRIMPRL